MIMITLIIRFHSYIFYILHLKGWVDDMLKWDPDDYGGVERISLRTDDIWMPDITAYERYI